MIVIDTKPCGPCSPISPLGPGGPFGPGDSFGAGDPRYTEVCVDTTDIRTKQRNHLVCIEL